MSTVPILEAPDDDKNSSKMTTTLPNDMITEILPRLPTKSVARFRCVCRFWNAETWSPSFLDRHPGLIGKLAFVRRARQCIWYRGRWSSWPRVIGAVHCRGFVLVENQSPTAYSVSVYNPTTGEVLRLPDQASWSGGEASPSSVVTGIGFHAEYYKVVQVTVAFGASSMQARVLTLGDDRGWRDLDMSQAQAATTFGDLTDDACIDWNIDPVFADGCIHWCFRTNRLNRDEPHGVISFSLADESFRRAPLPPFVTADRASYPHRLENRKAKLSSTGTRLAELDGRLCITRDVRRRNDAPGQFEVWKLHDYETGAWTLDYRIDLKGRAARRIKTSFVVPLMYMDGGCPCPGEKKRKMLLVTSEQRVQVYDPNTNSLRTVASVGYIRRFEDTLRIVLYQESRVRFPGMERCDTEIKFHEVEVI